MPRGGHDIPVSGTHLKGTQWLRRVDPTVGHLKGTPWSRRVWTPHLQRGKGIQTILKLFAFSFTNLIIGKTIDIPSLNHLFIDSHCIDDV